MSEWDPPKPKLDGSSPLIIRVLTQADFDQARLEVEEARQERIWQERHGWKDPKVGTCRVCSGKVYGHVRQEYDPRSGPMIIGPGSKSQIRAVHHGYECSECFLVYRKCPGAITTMTRDELERFVG